MTKRKKYTKEFKLDAISLVRDQNISVSEASRNHVMEFRTQEISIAQTNFVSC
jgi:transposase-like protein